MTLSLFLTIASLHLMAAVSPGPAVLMSARTGVTQGFRTGAALAAGIGAGGVLWAGAALFGLALLFQLAPALLMVFKLAGGAYLVWMAWHLWRDAAQPLDETEAGRLPQSLARAFRLGLYTQLANPKPAVLFSAIFVGTVPPGTGWPVYGALLAMVFFNETLWNIVVARVFSLDRTRRGYVGLKPVIDRAFGGFLGLLGLKIAAT